MEYAVIDQNKDIIKSGKISKNTEIIFPAIDNYHFTISGFTMSGTDIAKNYPDFQTYSWLDSTAINSVLILSILGWSLGMITMLWTAADTAIKTHTSIYWFFAENFGTNFANVVLGQFRDIFTLTGIFSMTFLSQYNMTKGSIGK